MKIQTIKISDGNGGFIIINDADFDVENHKKFLAEEDVVELITEADAVKMNRDELRDYAKPLGITGTSKEGIFDELKKGGYFKAE